MALVTGHSPVRTRTDGRGRAPSAVLRGRLLAGAIMSLLLVFAAPAAPAAAAVPVNQAPPSISGLLQEGELLTADPGTWTGSPTSYGYQWYSCSPSFVDCASIPGAIQQIYLVEAAQIGRHVGVDVIATNADGDSEPVVVAPVGPIIIAYPRIAANPSVAGVAQEGETLTASPGSWTPAPDGYAIQWYACDAAITVCDAIAGATAATYRLGPGDVGRRLGVGVVAINAGGSSDEAFSDLTEPVLAASAASPAANPLTPVQVTPPAPVVNSRFVTLRTRARADGKLEFSIRVRGAGRLTARATAGAALLARGCLTPCKRTGIAEYGNKTLTTRAAGIVKLVITPSARAARALRRSRTVPVRVKLTFVRAAGGPASSSVQTLIVKGALARTRAPLSPR